MHWPTQIDTTRIILRYFKKYKSVFVSITNIEHNTSAPLKRLYFAFHVARVIFFSVSGAALVLVYLQNVVAAGTSPTCTFTIRFYFLTTENL